MMKSTLEICHSSLSAETMRLKLNTPVLPANAAQSEVWQASYYLAKELAIKSTDWIAILGKLDCMGLKACRVYASEICISALPDIDRALKKSKKDRNPRLLGNVRTSIYHAVMNYGNEISAIFEFLHSHEEATEYVAPIEQDARWLYAEAMVPA